MKRIALGLVIIVAAGLVMSSCTTGRKGQRCPAYSKIDKTESSSERV